MNGGSLKQKTFPKIENVKGITEDAAKNAIETVSKSLKDLRIAEITRLDLTIEDGKVTGYRARINVSFKYHEEL